MKNDLIASSGGNVGIREVPQSAGACEHPNEVVSFSGVFVTG
jgi:hypothetical protein